MKSSFYLDPMSALVPVRDIDGIIIRTVDPTAVEVWIENGSIKKSMRKGKDGIWSIKTDGDPEDVIICKSFPSGFVSRRHNPYSFNPYFKEDAVKFKDGEDYRAYTYSGAHFMDFGKVQGFNFVLYAPSARGVSVVGDFNGWQQSVSPMFRMGDTGFWALFVPDIGSGELYKYCIIAADGSTQLKSDPFAFYSELRPGTASRTYKTSHIWKDRAYVKERISYSPESKPISIYEVHLGSWMKNEKGEFLSYEEIGKRMAEYLKDMGFTHVELLPVMEHPLDDSWGYQTTGYFCPTSRHGEPDDFKKFVDIMHGEGIGVILDWVPAHFPRDSSALGYFDGTNLYEYSDPLKRDHPDWGTYIFDYGKRSTVNFLISSASFWLEEYHIDGIRIDAVSSMLYLDYSRKDGNWRPNIYGGNENLEAISFLKELNQHIERSFPGRFTVAEESTSWNGVTREVSQGGLGFSMKWNMGWMHDILDYMGKDPIYRKYHHNTLTFVFWYAFSERYILPLSHDEVVYGKRSIYNKMPGDPWQKLANVRLLYSFMYSFPGKKLLFMGDEIPSEREWDFRSWNSLTPNNEVQSNSIRNLLKDLNILYRSSEELFNNDFNSASFRWIDYSDREQSVISFMRSWRDSLFIFIFNFTPVPRNDYRIGVPSKGKYEIIFNSDKEKYGGSGGGSKTDLQGEDYGFHGLPNSIRLDLPPLGAIFLRRKIK